MQQIYLYTIESSPSLNFYFFASFFFVCEENTPPPLYRVEKQQYSFFYIRCFDYPP
eukprot:UN10737